MNRMKVKRLNSTLSKPRTVITDITDFAALGTTKWLQINVVYISVFLNYVICASLPAVASYYITSFDVDVQ